MTPKRLLHFLALPLLLGLLFLWGPLSPATAFLPEDSKTHAAWSSTEPPVNLEHIFQGEINRRGRPVGYHSRPGGEDPRDARVTRVTAGPNRAGVYETTVEIRTPAGEWLSKRSTFFPDHMSHEEVLDAILHAYHNRTSLESNRFTGPSGRSFEIRGYLLPNGSINTAFPLYRRDR